MPSDVDVDCLSIGYIHDSEVEESYSIASSAGFTPYILALHTGEDMLFSWDHTQGKNALIDLLGIVSSYVITQDAVILSYGLQSLCKGFDIEPPSMALCDVTWLAKERGLGHFLDCSSMLEIGRHHFYKTLPKTYRNIMPKTKKALLALNGDDLTKIGVMHIHDARLRSRFYREKASLLFHGSDDVFAYHNQFMKINDTGVLIDKALCEQELLSWQNKINESGNSLEKVSGGFVKNIMDDDGLVCLFNWECMLNDNPDMLGLKKLTSIPENHFDIPSAQLTSGIRPKDKIIKELSWFGVENNILDGKEKKGDILNAIATHILTKKQTINKTYPMAIYNNDVILCRGYFLNHDSEVNDAVMETALLRQTLSQGRYNELKKILYVCSKNHGRFRERTLPSVSYMDDAIEKTSTKGLCVAQEGKVLMKICFESMVSNICNWLLGIKNYKEHTSWARHNAQEFNLSVQDFCSAHDLMILGEATNNNLFEYMNKIDAYRSKWRRLFPNIADLKKTMAMEALGAYYGKITKCGGNKWHIRQISILSKKGLLLKTPTSRNLYIPWVTMIHENNKSSLHYMRDSAKNDMRKLDGETLLRFLIKAIVNDLLHEYCKTIQGIDKDIDIISVNRVEIVCEMPSTCRKSDVKNAINKKVLSLHNKNNRNNLLFHPTITEHSHL